MDAFTKLIEAMGNADWGTVPDWVVAMSAALAAWQGWRSLSNWRKEAGGRRRLELAEEILTKVYEVAEALEEVRNPLGNTDENDGREDRENEDDRLRGYRDMYYPIFARLGRHRDTLLKLKALRFRSRAIFGDEFQEAIDKLLTLYDEIAKAIAELYYDLPWEGEQTEERFTRHCDLRDIIWATDGDAFSQNLRSKVETIELRLRPIIQKFSD